MTITVDVQKSASPKRIEKFQSAVVNTKLLHNLLLTERKSGLELPETIIHVQARNGGGGGTWLSSLVPRRNVNRIENFIQISPSVRLVGVFF
jgi:hypothetical protein